MLEKLFPKSEEGDRLIALARFLKKHKRFPRGGVLFNDFLYFQKSSGRLGEPLRRMTTDKVLM